MPLPIITPPPPVALRGLQSQLFTADQPVVWTCEEPGTITAGGLYTAPNRPGNFDISAENAALEITDFFVTVTPVHAYDASVGSEGQTKKIVKVNESVKTRRWTRKRSGAVRFYQLQFNERPEAEYHAARALYESCWPSAPFYWRDAVLNQERLFIFDSPFSLTRVTRGIYDYKFSLKEWLTYGVGTGITPVSSIFPYVADYGLEFELAGETFSSDALDMSREARLVDGTMKARTELTFYGRTPAEFLAAEAFWNYHYPGREITFQYGAQTNLTGAYKIDSDFSWHYTEHNLVDYKFIVRSV
jgi:hypothetical protein